jgi:hypothetical protein
MTPFATTILKEANGVTLLALTLSKEVSGVILFIPPMIISTERAG